MAKIVKPRTGGTLQSEDKWEYTVYSRDASGNVLAVYKMEYKSQGGNSYQLISDLKENHIYGGSRLGIRYDQQGVVHRTFTLALSGNGTFDFYYNPTCWTTNSLLKPTVSATDFKRELGYKAYELSNHLGNVLSTVSDRRISVGSAGVTTHFIPEVMTYTDYFVYGSSMPGRVFVSGNGAYRYTFNGKEQDAETDLQDYGFRIYNPALGKFLSVDPLTAIYPMLTPYQFASNTPIWAIDLDGLEAVPTTEVWDLNESIYTSASNVYGNYDKNGPFKVVYHGSETITLHMITDGPNAGNYMGIVHHGNYRNFWKENNDEGYMWEEKYIFGADRVPVAAFSRIDDLNVAVSGWIWDPENFSMELNRVQWTNALGKGYWDNQTGQWIDQSSGGDIVDGWAEIMTDPYAWAGGVTAYISWASSANRLGGSVPKKSGTATGKPNTNGITQTNYLGQDFQINSGHGFNRVHSNGVSFNPGLTQIQVENAIVADAYQNVLKIPKVGSNGQLPKGTKAYQGSTVVGGQKVSYRAVQQNGKISVGTYWPE